MMWRERIPALVLLGCVLVSPVTRAAESVSPRPAAMASVAVDPDSIDLQADVSRLDMESLTLLAAALEVRHCRLPADTRLRQPYYEYLRDRCGRYRAREAGAQPRPETPLTPPELSLLERIEQRQKQLRAGQVRRDDQGGLHYDPAAVANLSQFSTLPDSVQARLFHQGFVVAPSQAEQLFHIYEENDYRMIPSFITVDAVLQVYHLYFDMTLREIEQHGMLAAADSLVTGLRAALQERWLRMGAGPNDPDLRDGLRRAVLFCAVAEALVRADSSGTPPAWLDPAWGEDFARDMRLIHAARGKDQGAIAGSMDYSMFIPRGHYTRNADLRRYFRTLMWLGLAAFPVSAQEPYEPAVPIEAPLALCWELTHAPRLFELYKRIYEPTCFYVGVSDDVGPALVRAVADSLCGPDAGLEAWLARKEEIRRSLMARNSARIHGPGRSTEAGPPRCEVRFMGQRYIPESEIFETTTSEGRPFPSGLEVFGTMGIPTALRLLDDYRILPPELVPVLDRLRGELSDFALIPGQANLYWRWLRVLRTLNHPAPAAAPPFMATPAWRVKDLGTALASWAELRHDTILYAKQSGAECGGETETPTYPGYVEARPDVFAEILALHDFTTAELARWGLLTRRLTRAAEHFHAMLSFLERASRQQIDGRPLSQEDHDRIRVFGSDLEYLTLSLLTDNGGRWYEVYGPDRSIAVIADVHTAFGEVLEVGVGTADVLYALVEIEGTLWLTRGAVLSYYEFVHAASDRLTDEAWQRMLHEGKAPRRPRWVERYLIPQEPEPLPFRYRYSSGC